MANSSQDVYLTKVQEEGTASVDESDEHHDEMLIDSGMCEGTSQSPQDDRGIGNGHGELHKRNKSGRRSPMKFDRKLFDAEDSSDESGPGSHEVENENQSEEENENGGSADPKVLEKLEKMKGAAKNPRQQKPRKCKPTKDEMLELHSETHRLLRESHVHLPYHKPEPRSLKDFMERARRKQEVYQALNLKGARDIEKARMVQDQITEAPMVKLPRLHSSSSWTRLSVSLSQSHHTHTFVPTSSTSSQDFGLEARWTGNTDSALAISEMPSDASSIQANHNSEAGSKVNDELPDLVGKHSETLLQFQSVSKCSDDSQANENFSQFQAVTGSQAIGEYDSPNNRDSQEIEENGSVATKDGGSQPDEDVFEFIPDSLKEHHQVGQSADDNKAVSIPEHVQQKADTMDTSRESSSGQLSSQLTSNLFNSPENVASCKNGFSLSEDLLDSSSSNKQDQTEDISVKKTLPQQISLQTDEDLKLTTTPSLSLEADDFIILGESDVKEHHPCSQGVQELMARLLQQNKQKVTQLSTSVEISIVEKEFTEGAREELKLKTLTYQMELSDSAPSCPHACNPGSTLQALKQKLEVGMRQRRVAAYERRKQQFDLENEKGFEKGASDDGLPEEGEEETELTDGPDTDEEEEEIDEEEHHENDECDLEVAESITGSDDDDNDDKEENSYLEKEAEESDESWQDGDSDVNSAAEGDEDLYEETEPLHLRLDSSDEEDETAVCKKSGTGSRVRQLAISEDEEEDDLEEKFESFPHPPDSATSAVSTLGGKQKMTDVSFESDGLTPMAQLLHDTQPKYHHSSLSSGVEYSQDLYGGSECAESDHNNSTVGQTQLGSLSDDNLSQLLDADGYLRVATLKARPLGQTLPVLDSQEAEGEDMNIMGLCSGQFLESSANGQKDPALKGLFEGDSQSQDDRGSLTSLFEGCSQSNGEALHTDKLCSGGASQTSMGELLDLCSGQFHSSSNKQSQKKRGVKRKLDIGADEELGIGPFQILSDDEGSRDTEQLSGTEDEQVDNSGASTEKKTFQGFKKGGKMRSEFVEDEAELSGSEVESDDNVDLDEEDDYLELEEGDNDIEMDEEQLRDQVGRVHIKQVMDDDDQELMRYKDMYLPDGDLHSEGSGRLRRFHWKNIDEGSQQDIFNEMSDDEKDGEDADEKQWRMLRFEREKFLQEQQEQDQEASNSQLLQFGKFFMKRQISEPLLSVSTSQNSTMAKFMPVRSQSLAERSSPAKFIKPKIPKCGSFLARSKENLAKIAEINRPSMLNVSGTRGSRNFVFQVLSTKLEDEPAEKPAAEPAVAVPVKAAVHRQPAKKKCLEIHSVQPEKSIFQLLEK